jgi:phage terminase large subunit-like protein
MAERVAMLPPQERDRILRSLSTDEPEALEYDWKFRGRPSQLPPDDPDWVYWLMLAGRGSGKTRAGAEWVRAIKETISPIALIGATAADVRDVMIRGPAGLLAIAPPGDYPSYEPSNRRLVWRNGAIAMCFSAEEPDRLRGPQHAACWCDESAAWQYPDETWANLEFGLRVGDQPRAMITTTPRPIRLLRQLIADPLTRITRTSSYANASHLPQRFLDQIIARHEGTRLGRQEIYAELLDDVPGALWTRQIIDDNRLPYGTRLGDMKRIVVAIDPAVTSGEEADETGIIVACCDWNGHGYVLADLSGRYQPIEWARIAIEQYRLHKADRIVAEVNNGGEMVEHTIKMTAGDEIIPFSPVHASRGKAIRAEPVSALYEQNRVHHLGYFAKLEDQMSNFTIDYDRTKDVSPDRMDALVWAFHDLLVEAGPPPVIVTKAMLDPLRMPMARMLRRR